MRQNSGSNGNVDASTSFLPIPEREFVLPQSTHCTLRTALVKRPGSRDYLGYWVTASKNDALNDASNDASRSSTSFETDPNRATTSTVRHPQRRRGWMVGRPARRIRDRVLRPQRPRWANPSCLRPRSAPIPARSSAATAEFGPTGSRSMSGTAQPDGDHLNTLTAGTRCVNVTGPCQIVTRRHGSQRSVGVRARACRRHASSHAGARGRCRRRRHVGRCGGPPPAVAGRVA